MKIAVFIALLVFSAAIKSQQPVPSTGIESHPPQGERAKAKRQAQPDQRGTENAPLVIKGFPPAPQPKGDAEREAKERDEKTANEGRLTVYTGALAILTLGLVVVAAIQASLFIWQLTLMRKATQAAWLQATAALGMALPILRCKPVELMALQEPMPEHGPYAGGINDALPTKYSAVSRFTFKNFGQTIAFPEILHIGWAVVEELPDEPVYRKSKTLRHAAFIKRGGEYEPDFHAGIELADSEVALAASGTGWLWLYGKLDYRDFMNRSRDFRFCWRYADQNVGQHHPMYAFGSDGNPPQAYVGRQPNSDDAP